jgi:hypothetical protein
MQKGILAKDKNSFNFVRPTINEGAGSSATGDPLMYDFAFMSSAASYTGRTMTAAAGAVVTWTIEGASYSTITAPTVTLSGNKKIFFRVDPASKLSTFVVNQNSLSGYLPSLANFTAMTVFNCYSNSLIGQFPDLTANTLLSTLDISSNQFTGAVPNTLSLAALRYCQFRSNLFTGAVPDLSANTQLVTYYCSLNQLSGDIPSLSASAGLTTVEFYSNQFTGVAAGFAVPASLHAATFQNNLLTQGAVDAILAAFVLAAASGAYTLNIGGTGNATPSAAGLTDKATLQGRGWTVTTN